MIKKILDVFKIKAAWLCSPVTKTAEGIEYTITLIKTLVAEVDGSSIGEKYIETADSVVDFLISAHATLVTVSQWTCSTPIPSLELVSQSAESKTDEQIDEILSKLKDITNDLS